MSAPSIEMNEQFEHALNLLEHEPHHLFITGRAGTGKSTLLTHFRRHTQLKHVVLAPTGIAAINVDGQTIHSFFRFYPNISLSGAREQAFKMKHSEALYNALDVLIIDEISMVRCDLLDCMDVFLRTIRKKKQPFGGVRLVCFGDLYQLPPVVRGDEMSALRQIYDTHYFFSAKVFQQLLQPEQDLFRFIELEKIYRQTDQTFIDFLNAIRNKTMTSDQFTELNKRVVEDDVWSMMDQHAVILTATNAQADQINQMKLQELDEKICQFEGTVIGTFERSAFPAEEQLRLKKHARVMMVNNDSDGAWVNGSMGKVTDIFYDKEISETVVEVRLDTGDTISVTPHTWELSQSYYNAETQSIEREPVGRFRQYPLKLAWAMTIHKSQGKTFDKVVIDLGRGAFAAGQTYVALSRCRTLEGVTFCKPIKPSDIRLDHQIVKFLNDLQTLLANPIESTTSQIL